MTSKTVRRTASARKRSTWGCEDYTDGVHCMRTETPAHTVPSHRQAPAPRTWVARGIPTLVGSAQWNVQSCDDARHSAPIPVHPPTARTTLRRPSLTLTRCRAGRSRTAPWPWPLPGSRPWGWCAWPGWDCRRDSGSGGVGVGGSGFGVQGLGVGCMVLSQGRVALIKGVVVPLGCCVRRHAGATQASPCVSHTPTQTLLQQAKLSPEGHVGEPSCVPLGVGTLPQPARDGGAACHSVHTSCLQA